jgi:hypothetical protein
MKLWLLESHYERDWPQLHAAVVRAENEESARRMIYDEYRADARGEFHVENAKMVMFNKWRCTELTSDGAPEILIVNEDHD